MQEHNQILTRGAIFNLRQPRGATPSSRLISHVLRPRVSLAQLHPNPSSPNPPSPFPQEPHSPLEHSQIEAHQKSRTLGFKLARVVRDALSGIDFDPNRKNRVRDTGTPLRLGCLGVSTAEIKGINWMLQNPAMPTQRLSRAGMGHMLRYPPRKYLRDRHL